MNDAQLLEQFLNHTLNPELMNHETHLRLAWCLLQKHPLAEAIAFYRDGLLAIVAKVNLQEKYNETITYALMLVIYDRINHSKKGGSFNDFLAENCDLQDDCIGVLRQFYKPETLFSDAARIRFHFPDRPHSL